MRSVPASFFISTCQLGAGEFQNCLPATASQPTDLARIAFQRRYRMRLHPAHPDDPWGDDIQNMGQHTTRHTDVNEVWEQAFTYCFGKHNLIIGPRNQGAAVEWSPGHIPDITALNKAPGGFHVLGSGSLAGQIELQFEASVLSVNVFISNGHRTVNANKTMDECN